MKKMFRTCLLVAAWMGRLGDVLPSALAQTTAFTYQGRLEFQGSPAEGPFDFTFELHDQPDGGAPLGNLILSNPGIAVSNGVFTATLDFGSSLFTGADRWLDISVRPAGGGSFTRLVPRQALTSTPYAVRARNASQASTVPPGAVTTAMLADGAVTESKLAAGAVTRVSAPGGNPASALQADANGRIGIGTNNSSGAALQIAGGGSYLNPGSAAIVSVVANGTNGVTRMSQPIRVRIDGARLYVTAYQPGSLQIFDLANPRQPAFLGEAVDNAALPQSPFAFLAGAGGLAVSKNIAYVSAENDNALTLINVSQPQSPQLLAVLRHGQGGVNGLQSPTEVIVADGLCYVLGFSSSSLSIFDVHQPTQPVLLSEVFDRSVSVGSPFTRLLNPHSMTLVGTRLYIACRGANAITIIDVAEPRKPILVKEIADRTVDPSSAFTRLVHPNGIEVVDSLAYVVSGPWTGVSSSLTIMDLKDPQSPKPLAEVADESQVPGSPFTQLGNAWAVKLVGTTAFVTSAADGGLTAIDVSDPTRPTPQAVWVNGKGGVHTLSQTSDLTSNGNLLYVLSRGSDGDAINVFDLDSQLGLQVAGAVGIGTAAPRTELEVAGTVTARAVAVEGSVNVDADAQNRGAVSPGLLFGNDGQAGIASSHTPGPNPGGLDFYTGGTARVSLRNNGNLGLGTADPQSQLTVQRTVPGGRGAELSLVNAAAPNAGNEVALNFGVENSTYQADTPNAQVKARLVNGGTSATDLVLSTWDGASFGDRLHVRYDGNVGIGTATPGARATISGDFSNTQGIGLHVLGLGPSGAGLSFEHQSATWGIGMAPGATRLSVFANRNPSRAGAEVVSFTPNGFVGIGNPTPIAPLQVGNAFCNGLIWVNASDRELKEDFAPIDPLAVLEKVAAMPLQSWVYKHQPAERHIGPMAQDFHAAFGLNGADERHISTIDEGGVALAAIQGLNRRLEEELRKRDAENAALKAELAEIRKAIATLQASR